MNRVRKPAPGSCVRSQLANAASLLSVLRRALVAGLFASVSLIAQVPEGYDDRVVTLPPSAGQILRTAQGMVAFDGTQLTLTPPTLPPIVLLQFPAAVFGAFTVPADQGFVLFGESSTGALWQVSLTGAVPPRNVATIPFHYDAVMIAPGQALVSARTGGWSATVNDLLLLDLATGTSQLVAQLPGSSGPVERTPAGDVYYATATPLWPPPPGTVSILRTTVNALLQAAQNSQVLGLAHFQTLVSGLDAAGDLALDDDGDLFFVDWFNDLVGELDDVATGAAQPRTLVDYGALGVSPATLQFFRAQTGVAFEPFQPAGGELCIYETDYFSLSQQRQVVTARPVTDVTVADPIPAGPFAIRTQYGPAGGHGLLAVAFAAPPMPVQIALAGFEAPLVWDSSLQAPLFTLFVSLDAQGAVQVPFVNPGIATPLPCVGMVAVLDAGARVIASGNRVSFTLGQ